MSRVQCELLFLVGLSILTYVLFSTVTIYKTEFFIFSSWNPTYMWTFIGINILYILFNHFVIEMSFIKNLLYSFVSIVLLFVLSFLIVNAILGYLDHLDNLKSPLGWQFQYRWFELFVYGFLLVVSTEVYGKKLKKKS